MTTIEVIGKNVEEALKSAASELGVPESEVGYEVLDEGSKGFLGIGGSPARIKAWRKQEARARKHEPRERPEPRAKREPRRERPPREPVEAHRPEKREEPRVPPPAAEGHEELFALLRDALAAMRLDVHPQIRNESDEEVVVDLVGEDVAILIGRHGQTLDALQFLVSIAIGRGGKDTRKRIILDAEGYRERHAETLRRKAREYARQVKRSGQEAVLDPQPARDRRIIHTALADDPDVYTYSEGEGDDRHVVISPRK